MDKCIFCEIARGAIPARKAFESDDILAFHDIKPQAPVHVQIIPKAHIPTLNELLPRHRQLLGDMVLAAQSIARDFNIAETGYRLVFNCGPHSGQEVYHIHLHLLGGRPFGWPPG